MILNKIFRLIKVHKKEEKNVILLSKNFIFKQKFMPPKYFFLFKIKIN